MCLSVVYILCLMSVCRCGVYVCLMSLCVNVVCMCVYLCDRVC